MVKSVRIGQSYAANLLYLISIQGDDNMNPEEINNMNVLGKILVQELIDGINSGKYVKLKMNTIPRDQVIPVKVQPPKSRAKEMASKPFIID